MKALILAAGYAVRLRPLTLNTSKSLLEIGKKKIVDRIIDKLSGIKGLDEIYVITNARFFDNFKDWIKRSYHKDKISLINDGTMTNETRHGAIKDIKIAIAEKAIDDDLVVVAGDNLFELDLNKFLNFAGERRDGVSVALYDLKDVKAATKFGVVQLDDDKRIIDFEEKPERPKSALVSTCIYYFPKEKIGLIDKYVGTQDKKLDAPGHYISWLSKTERVYGFVFTEKWYDIGDIETYNSSHEEYLKKEKQEYGKK